MNGAELVRLITNVLFLVVFVGALRTALRERTRTSVDATILFGALAVVIAQSQVATLLGTQLPAAFGLVSAILLLALPYLQLRLVDDFADLRSDREQRRIDGPRADLSCWVCRGIRAAGPPEARLARAGSPLLLNTRRRNLTARFPPDDPSRPRGRDRESRARPIRAH